MASPICQLLVNHADFVRSDSRLDEELRFYAQKFHIPSPKSQSPKEPSPEAPRAVLNPNDSPHANRLARSLRFREIFEEDEAGSDPFEDNRCKNPTPVTRRKNPALHRLYRIPLTCWHANRLVRSCHIINHSEWRSDFSIILHKKPPSLIQTPDDFFKRVAALQDKLLDSRLKSGLDSRHYEESLAFVLDQLYELVGKPVIDRLRRLL